MLVTGSSLEEAEAGGWLLGPLDAGSSFWEPWVARAVTDADWFAILGQGRGIAAAVFVAVIAMLFHVSGSEEVLDRNLDANRELRDAGALNVVSGAIGGIPGYHALNLSALAHRMGVSARFAGLVAMLVPLAAVVVGAAAVEMLPRAVLGGMLMFLGLALIVEWVWERRRTLPKIEYVFLLLILATIVGQGFLPGVVVGLVIGVVLFAISYGRVEQVREVAFGDTYRSNVDRPPAERRSCRRSATASRSSALHGFVFFGTSSGLLERIRQRVNESPTRFLVLDLRRVTGVDSSAVVSFVKVIELAEAGRVRARADRRVGPGPRTARAGWGRRVRRGRPLRAGPGSRAAARARTCCSRRPWTPPGPGRATRVAGMPRGPACRTSSASRSPRGPC